MEEDNKIVDGKVEKEKDNKTTDKKDVKPSIDFAASLQLSAEDIKKKQAKKTDEDPKIAKFKCSEVIYIFDIDQ